MICAFDKEKAECVAVEKGIYKTPGGKRLDMLICYPQTTPKGCILLIHGGGWKSDTCERLRLHAQYAAMCGAVGASVSYRLLDEKNGVDVRDGLEDCVNALSYIRKICEKKYGKISVIAAGDSAGGYYAACLGCGALMKKYGVKPVDFVVDWNGIVDLTGKWSYGICLKNTDTKNKKEIEREYSPLYNVSRGDAPVLIMHGTCDKTVALSDSASYRERLNKTGIDNDMLLLEGASHAFILFDYKHDNAYVAEILQNVLEVLAGKQYI